MASVSSTAASAADATSALFRNDVLKRGPTDCRKERVVQREKAEVAPRRGIDACADAAGDHRNGERQEEHGQEQLTRPCRNRHRGHEDADRADADIRQRNRCDRRAVDAGEEDREQRQRDRLGERKECERRQRLSEPDGAAIRRREHEPVENALLALRDERARGPEQRGEDNRHPEQAQARELAGARRQREVENHERGRDEDEHRRQRVARAHLEQQILAREGRDVSDVLPHASASRADASDARRSGSCVATRNVASPQRDASSRSSSSAPSASSAEKGSSRRSNSGSCRNTRQSASRCTIPRENDETRSFRTSQRPNRSSSIPLRSRRSGTRYSRPYRSRFSSAVSSRYTSGSCPRKPTHSRGTSTPPPPEVGTSSPARSRSSVVFPEPFGPVTSRNPPRGRSSST